MKIMLSLEKTSIYTAMTEYFTWCILLHLLSSFVLVLLFSHRKEFRWMFSCYSGKNGPVRNVFKPSHMLCTEAIKPVFQTKLRVEIPREFSNVKFHQSLAVQKVKHPEVWKRFPPDS